LGDHIRYVGLDVHKDGTVVAVAEGGRRGEVRDYGRIPNSRRLCSGSFARHNQERGAQTGLLFAGSSYSLGDGWMELAMRLALAPF
jgi:hypothetical protein